MGPGAAIVAARGDDPPALRYGFGPGLGRTVPLTVASVTTMLSATTATDDGARSGQPSQMVPTSAVFKLICRTAAGSALVTIRRPPVSSIASPSGCGTWEECRNTLNDSLGAWKPPTAPLTETA